MNPPPVYDNPRYKSVGKLQNYRTLITGGDSGIGRAVAVAFDKEGADVAIAYSIGGLDASQTADTVERCKAAVPLMKNGASIINTTSVVAYKGSQTLMDYASTKGAVVSFTRSLSLSLAGNGIRVNAVAPGPVWTSLIPSSFTEEVALFGSDVPLGRLAQPFEIAPAYVFPACEDSAYMTGQVLHVYDGTITNS